MQDFLQVRDPDFFLPDPVLTPLHTSTVPVPCSSVADPGCFIPDQSTFSIPDPKFYVKRKAAKVNILFSCGLQFQEYGKL
jgi:hypothetical protein